MRYELGRLSASKDSWAWNPSSRIDPPNDEYFEHILLNRSVRVGTKEEGAYSESGVMVHHPQSPIFVVAAPGMVVLTMLSSGMIGDERVESRTRVREINTGKKR